MYTAQHPVRAEVGQWNGGGARGLCAEALGGFRLAVKCLLITWRLGKGEGGECLQRRSCHLTRISGHLRFIFFGPVRVCLGIYHLYSTGLQRVSCYLTLVFYRPGHLYSVATLDICSAGYKWG